MHLNILAAILVLRNEEHAQKPTYQRSRRNGIDVNTVTFSLNLKFLIIGICLVSETGGTWTGICDTLARL